MVRRRRELYVECGGDRNPSLASECRKAFSELLRAAGVAERPRVIACGGRGTAFRQFCHAHAENDADVWLLVDAEELPAGAPSPWDHVNARVGDQWERPDGATDDQLQLMTVCVETWLIADPAALRSVFGPEFDAGKLPDVAQLETTPKAKIDAALKAAARDTKTGGYAKGSHSFRTLAKVSPSEIRRLRWGRRFLEAMGAPA